MYFESRMQAGVVLAEQLLKNYRYEDCAVLALNDGGVLVGEQIASYLHCALMLLISESIEVPGEGMSFGAVSQTGSFTFNSGWSQGEVNEYSQEFHGYLAEKKREAMQKINRLLGDGGTVDESLLKNRVVIVVSDGFHDLATMDVVFDFLKPLRIQKIVMASPIASVDIVDRIHIRADELHILDVKANYLDTDHYYTDNKIPNHEQTVERINQMILNWR